MRLLLTLAVLMVGLLAGSYAVSPVPKEKPKTTAQKAGLPHYEPVTR